MSFMNLKISCIFGFIVGIGIYFYFERVNDIDRVGFDFINIFMDGY